MKFKNFGIVALCGVFTILIVGLIGWVMNIVALFGTTEFSGMMAARILGVVIPFIGAVLGYI